MSSRPDSKSPLNISISNSPGSYGIWYCWWHPRETTLSWAYPGAIIDSVNVIDFAHEPIHAIHYDWIYRHIQRLFPPLNHPQGHVNLRQSSVPLHSHSPFRKRRPTVKCWQCHLRVNPAIDRWTLAFISGAPPTFIFGSSLRLRNMSCSGLHAFTYHTVQFLNNCLSCASLGLFLCLLALGFEIGWVFRQLQCS